MNIVIRISVLVEYGIMAQRNLLDKFLTDNYVKGIQNLRLACSQEVLVQGKKKEYDVICKLLRSLPPLYVREPIGYQLKSQAIVWERLQTILKSITWNPFH